MNNLILLFSRSWLAGYEAISYKTWARFRNTNFGFLAQFIMNWKIHCFLIAEASSSPFKLEFMRFAYLKIAAMLDGACKAIAMIYNMAAVVEG